MPHLRFTEHGIGKVNKRVFFKRKAKARLKGEMRRDADEISLTPWNKMTHYSWWW